MSRKRARTALMQLLYSMDLKDNFDIGELELFRENFEFEPDELEYLDTSVEVILNNLQNIDDMLSKNLEGWTISRLSNVDREILRVAIYEILYRDDIPMEVSINEAVQIAKEYSLEESPKFINGILGSIYRYLNL